MPHRLNRLRYLILSLIALNLTAQALPAAAASYGDFQGGPASAYSYFEVNDHSSLIGAPTLSGSQLYFGGNTFESTCSISPSCPPSPSITSDSLNLEIAAEAGHSVDLIGFSLEGNARLRNFLGLAASSYTFSMIAEVLEVDGTALASPLSASVQRGADFTTFAEGFESFAFAHSTTDTRVDLALLLANAGLSGRATRVALRIEISLITYAEVSASAFIELRDGFALAVIPEPGTGILLGLGLVMASLNRTQARS